MTHPWSIESNESIPNESTPIELTDWRRLLEVQYQNRGLEVFRDRDVIPLANHEVWLVYRGVVLLESVVASGLAVALGFVPPTMPFGLPLTASVTYRAIALGEVALLRLSMVQIESSPVLVRGLVQQSIRRLQQTSELVALATRRRAADRLRSLLRLLAQDLGRSMCHEGVWVDRLPIRLTHHHLAMAASTSRVTVTRLLGQFQREGWLSWDHDHHYLIRCVGSGP